MNAALKLGWNVGNPSTFPAMAGEIFKALFKALSPRCKLLSAVSEIVTVSQ